MIGDRECECGCLTVIANPDSYGRVRQFKRGHNSRVDNPNKGGNLRPDVSIRNKLNPNPPLFGEENPNYGKKHPGLNAGETNPMWKGDRIDGSKSVHEWIRRRKPKPEFCEACGINPPQDLANMSGWYLRELGDYEWLCRSCHMRKDGRIFNLRNQSR